MREDLVSRLACPRCRSALALVERNPDRGPVEAGVLRCASCGASRPIRDGVPRLVDDPGVRDTQASFAAQWRSRLRGGFESDTLFGLTPEEEERMFFEALGLAPGGLRGRWVLDAGCGSGRLTRRLAALGAQVVGLDVAPSIVDIAREAVALPNLDFVQGSLLNAPLANASFDVVWSMGVIHHTGDTSRAFENLARLVRPEGRLYVWVYSARQPSLYKLIRDAMQVSFKIPKGLLFWICYMMAPPLKAYHLGKFALRRLRGQPVTPRERREARIRTIAFELHDDLAPPHQTRHTPEEVSDWFRAAGFDGLVQVGEVGFRGTRRAS